MPPLSRGTRRSLIVFVGATGALVASMLVLMSVGIAQHPEYDASRLLITLAIGLGVSIMFAVLLGLMLRQQIGGYPRVVASDEGMTVGSTFIPWSEIDDVSGADLFGMPHVGVVLSKPALKRLPRTQRWQASVPAGDGRAIFFSERQIGEILGDGAPRIWEAWSRHHRREA